MKSLVRIPKERQKQVKTTVAGQKAFQRSIEKTGESTEKFMAKTLEHMKKSQTQAEAARKRGKGKGLAAMEAFNTKDFLKAVKNRDADKLEEYVEKAKVMAEGGQMQPKEVRRLQAVQKRAAEAQEKGLKAAKHHKNVGKGLLKMDQKSAGNLLARNKSVTKTKALMGNIKKLMLAVGQKVFSWITKFSAFGIILTLFTRAIELQRQSIKFAAEYGVSLVPNS